MDYLENIIGLAAVDAYGCWSSSNETGWTAANAAKSTYYVDTNEYTPDLSNVKDLGALLIECRKGAVEDAVLKLRVAASRLVSMNVDNYEDQIGQPDKGFNAVRGIEGSKIGIRFEAGHFYKDVSFRIKKASLKIDTSGTYTVRIYRVFPTVAQIGSGFDIDVTAGVVSYSNTLTTSIPLSHEGTKAQYVAYWERKGNEKPYNVQYTCGCGDESYWYSSGHLKVAGFDADSIDNIAASDFPNNTHTRGLHFNIEFECDALSWMENVTDSFWLQNAIGTTFAKVVQYLATKRLINKLIDENSPNAYNMLAKETMLTNGHKINSITKGLIDWVAVSIGESSAIASKTDCISCKPQIGMKMNTDILS